jgi:beta-galactosidase
MTAFREPKRGLLWYPSELLDEPYLHIEEQWKEGLEKLTVYSNAEEVELLVNGEPLMKQTPSADPKYEGLNHPPFEFAIREVIPGTLEARGLVEGKAVVSQTIQTPGAPMRVHLVADTVGRSFDADGSDILVVYAQIVDDRGTPVEDIETSIHFRVIGPASVVGDGDDIDANPCRVRKGAAPALIRAGTQRGEITIVAEADGLESGSVTVETVSSDPDVTLEDAGPIHDLQRIRVDIGAHDQLMQFDWVPWNGEDNQASTREFDALGGFSASLRPASDDGILRWLGEMNVIGKYGFAYGEGVIAMDEEGLVLEFNGLPEGLYRLRTWHHAPRSNTDSMDPNREKLKTLTIPKLPYATELDIAVSDADSNAQMTTRVTEGKEMQFVPVAVAEVLLASDGVQPVQVQFRDTKGEKGVWLNAFELTEWHPQLANLTDAPSQASVR